MMDTVIENTLTKEAWKKIGVKHHFGITLPLSALRSEKSAGIGEFLDLLPLIEWCQSLGLDLIQLLPLNDSGSDPSPYNALSLYALNPVYIALHALPYLDTYKELQEKLLVFKSLNYSQYVDYEKVYKEKIAWLTEYFLKTREHWEKDTEFLSYVADNPWLSCYSQFKALKKYFHQTSWETWPDHFKDMGAKEEEFVKSNLSDELFFNNLLQYLCFSQLTEVKKHANACNVFLKGDIPILISRDSADVWYYRNFFRLDVSAGAPPDQYNKEGQYWGFPIFNWSALEKEDYSLWRERLRYANHFYDIYRIDHVVGFFRIWAIPLRELSIKGKFIPEDPSLWYDHGKTLLSMLIESSTMLPLAEDLGTIPPITRPCLEELGICGTKVIRWERNWEGDKSFLPVNTYPPLSMTCVSTHDSETLTLWWRDLPEDAALYAKSKGWEYTPDLKPFQREAILKDSLHSSSLFHVNLLQEYLALFTELVWPLPEQERINVPGKLLPTNWTYRFRPFLEEIIAHEGLKTSLKSLMLP